MFLLRQSWKKKDADGEEKEKEEEEGEEEEEEKRKNEVAISLNVHVLASRTQYPYIQWRSLRPVSGSLHTITYFQNIKFIMAVIGQMKYLVAAIQFTFRQMNGCE